VTVRGIPRHKKSRKRRWAAPDDDESDDSFFHLYSRSVDSARSPLKQRPLLHLWDIPSQIQNLYQNKYFPRLSPTVLVAFRPPDVLEGAGT
jgi:hypothetical protein